MAWRAECAQHVIVLQWRRSSRVVPLGCDSNAWVSSVTIHPLEKIKYLLKYENLRKKKGCNNAKELGLLNSFFSSYLHTKSFFGMSGARDKRKITRVPACRQ